MFWADRIAEEIEKRFGKPKEALVIRDEKTVSGRVHVGSMRGVAIHGVVSEALTERGIPNVFTYEFNDFDPMDDIPAYLDRATYEPHLGKPLYTIPSPEPSAKNYGEYFAKEFQSVIEGAGWHPEFYWASELYLSGSMDGVIREALESADTIRRIQKEVSGADRKPGWLPVSVICPTCGKISTTDATDFDGKTVLVNCYPTKVAYTKGCGFEGRVSPFGGKAKLFWKADWPAKWKVNGVKIEGAGKDHSTKGGSRDVGNHIAKEVFHYEPPFDVPYEFFLVGGQKMSSSKGRGSSAKEISGLVPAKIFRLALLGKDINQAINFDPRGDTIPVLYDQYDKLAENHKAGVKDDYARLFEFLHPAEVVSKKSSAAPRLFSRQLPPSTFTPRFSQVAFLVQMPHLNAEEEVQKIKGEELTVEDKKELTERAEYAKKWLAEYAPEKFVFKLQETLPEAAKNLNDRQKQALRSLKEFIEAAPSMPSGEDLHQKLHESKEFKAVYLAFLGKESGPKAGWFLSVLDREFVLKRLQEASV